MASVVTQVPDEAHDMAAASGETVETVAERRLQQWVVRRREEDEDARIVRQRWADVEAGAAELEDWEDVKAELDAGPTRQALG